MDEDRSSLLLGVTWMWTSLSTLAVVGRLYARKANDIKLWWDDFWVILSLVSGPARLDALSASAILKAGSVSAAL